jgi:hypothetical protein
MSAADSNRALTSETRSRFWFRKRSETKSNGTAMPGSERHEFPKRTNPGTANHFEGDSDRRTSIECQFLAALMFTIYATGIPAQAPATTAPGSSASTHACFVPGLVPNAHRTLSDDELLAAYNVRAVLVQSLEATVMLRGKGGSEFGKRAKDSRPAPAMLSFRAPGSLRMTGAIPFSARRSFDLSSDGGQFRLLVPDGKVMRFFVGPVDAPATSQNPRENLRPQPVIDSLRWLHGTLNKTLSGTGSGMRGPRVIVVDLPVARDGSVRRADIAFDLLSGTITSLTIHDMTARAVTEIHYADWQEIADRMNGSSSACFPRRIVVNQSLQNLQIEMKILSLRLNPAIPTSRFQLVPPRGIPVTPVGSLTKGKGQ